LHEKIATGRGIYPIEDLHGAARAFSRTLYAFDALVLAREHGTEANSVLLGALAGSGVLPIRVDAYRDAIRTKGVQVDANLRGFDAGLAVATRLKAGGGEGARDPSLPPSPTRPALDTDTEREVRLVRAALRPRPAAGTPRRA